MSEQRRVARVARVIKNNKKNIYTIYEKNNTSVNSEDTSQKIQEAQIMNHKKTTFNKIFNENQRTYKNQTQRSRSNSNLSQAETVLSQAETVKNLSQAKPESETEAKAVTGINFQLLVKKYPLFLRG